LYFGHGTAYGIKLWGKKKKKLETCGRESLGIHYQFSENVFDLFLVKILKKSYMHFRSDISMMCVKVYGSASLWTKKFFFNIEKNKKILPKRDYFK